jgi:hypothetical protein
MNLIIKRNYFKEAYIIGSLFVDDVLFCDSLERPWLNNQENISCIPEGDYKVQMLFSPKHQRIMPHVMDVPNRTVIEIHPANFVTELLGCVAVGKNTAPGTLTDSREISDKLNAILSGQTDINLHIS